MKSITTRLLSGALVVLIIAAVAALAGLPATGRALPDITTTPSRTPSAFIHLPLIRYDASATPTSTPTQAPTPTITPYSAAAAVTITRFRPINASTFNSSSIIIANDSLDGQRLTEVRIDLSTAIFPDMVFDPEGLAGDTVAKDVTVDVREGLGFIGHTYEGAHDDGFDVLVMQFQFFDRGDRFEFSVDVDPTSIRGVGAPGPNETGSVGGLEMVGATITATFDDGTVLVNDVYRLADPGSAGSDHSGAVALLRPGAPERPVIELLGGSSPEVVSDPNQTVRVQGPVGRPVIVLVAEGGLFTDGLPGGGFDLDPFEANSAITTREYTAVIGPGGAVDVPIALSRSLSDGGLNYVTAVFDDHYGRRGAVAAPLVLELE